MQTNQMQELRPGVEVSLGGISSYWEPRIDNPGLMRKKEGGCPLGGTFPDIPTDIPTKKGRLGLSARKFAEAAVANSGWRCNEAYG